jgi:FRG domain
MTGDTVDIGTVGSWRELDRALADNSWRRHPDRVHPAVVYRGLKRSSYRNVHSLARLRGDYAAMERHLVRSFRKYAYRRNPGPTAWDWLSLGRHHGLPTRLLDWTYSPLVALHFATLGPRDDEAILWEVDCAGVHEELPDGLRGALEHEGARVFTTELLAAHAADLEALDEFGSDNSFVLFFEPPSLDERIDNQAAVLSVGSAPDLQVEDWLPGHDHVWRAWRIPADVKVEIRARLDRANMTERVLVPGLDGLAAWLTRYYSPPDAWGAEEGGASMT